MNILIVNYHSDRNAGDRVLLTVTLDELRRRFPQAQIGVVTNDPTTYGGQEPCIGSFTTWVKKQGVDGDAWRVGGLLALPFRGVWTILAALAHRWGLWPSRPSPQSRFGAHGLLRSYADADLIVSCAGNFLYSSGAVGLPFLMAVFSLGYGVLMGKPVTTMPQTIGPLRRAWERRLLAGVLPHLRLLMLRDQISLDLVRALSPDGGIPCRLTPDIAFAFQGQSKEAGRRFLVDHGLPLADDRPLLGITAINWGGLNRDFSGQAAYERAMAEAATHFIRTQGGCVVLFAQVCGPTPSEDDRIPARRIHGLIPAPPGDVLLIDEFVPAGTLQAAYANMDLFLGTRLHSNIFALNAGVPVLAVAYQYKTFGIMSMMGLSEWTVAIEEITGQGLCAQLDDLWSQRQSVAAHIAQRTAALRAEIDQALDFVAQDFQSR